MRRRDALPGRVGALAEHVLHRRRETPRRRRTIAAAAFAVVTHLAILGLFLYAAPRLWIAAREPRSMSLDIVPSMLVLKPAAPRPRGGQPRPAPPAPSAFHAPQTREPSPTQGVAAPPSPTPIRPSDSVDTAALGRALRGSVIGCAHTDMANLTEAERQHCRDSLAANRADTPDLSQLAISPEKRAVFDAAWKADHSPQHPAGVICLARFGGGKLQWLHPSEGVKLGPLPCYVYTPKATFSADPPHARGWQ